MIGFVVLFNYIIIFLLARAYSSTVRTREAKMVVSFLEWQALAHRLYALCIVAMLFVFTGLWIPYFYVSSHIVVLQQLF